MSLLISQDMLLSISLCNVTSLLIRTRTHTMSNDTTTVVSANDDFTLDATARTFIWIICGAVIQTVNLFGIVSNAINIMCFAKQGLKEAINISFLGKDVHLKSYQYNVLHDTSAFLLCACILITTPSLFP